MGIKSAPLPASHEKSVVKGFCHLRDTTDGSQQTVIATHLQLEGSIG